MTTETAPSRKDRLVEALFSATAVKLATKLHILIVAPLLLSNLLNLVLGFQFYSGETLFLFNICAITVSAICMAHCMVSSQRARLRFERQIDEHGKIVALLHEKIEADLLASLRRVSPDDVKQPRMH